MISAGCAGLILTQRKQLLTKTKLHSPSLMWYSPVSVAMTTSPLLISVRLFTRPIPLAYGALLLKLAVQDHYAVVVMAATPELLVDDATVTSKPRWHLVIILFHPLLRARLL